MDLLDEIRIIGQTGLFYADNPYDKKRYSRLLQLASRKYSTELGLPESEVKNRMAGEFGHVTPKVGTTTAAFNSEGDILVIKERSRQGLALPGGYLQANETPKEGAIRETKEETGVVVKIDDIVGAFEVKSRPEHGPHGAVTILYLAKVVEGEPTETYEASEAKFISPELVENWVSDHRNFVECAVNKYKNRE